jgi:hypothetical protein
LKLFAVSPDLQYFNKLLSLEFFFRRFEDVCLDLDLECLRSLTITASNRGTPSFASSEPSPSMPNLPNLEAFLLEDRVTLRPTTVTNKDSFYKLALIVLQGAGDRLRQVALLRSPDKGDHDAYSPNEFAVLGNLGRRRSLDSLVLPHLDSRIVYKLRAHKLQFGSDSYPSSEAPAGHRHPAGHPAGDLLGIEVGELIFERHSLRDFQMPPSTRKLVITSDQHQPYVSTALWSGMFAGCESLREVDFTRTRMASITLHFLRKTHIEVLSFRVRCQVGQGSGRQASGQEMVQYLMIPSLKRLRVLAGCRCCSLTHIMDYDYDKEERAANPRVVLGRSQLQVLELGLTQHSDQHVASESREWVTILNEHRPFGFRRLEVAPSNYQDTLQFLFKDCSCVDACSC